MISIVVAYTREHVIGRAGTIPWHVPNDLRHFKRLTSGHTVLMGRKTFESIGRPLPQRRNLVLTRQSHLTRPGIEVVQSKEEALALDQDLFVIGGAEVYREFLPLADRLYITEIALEIAGDTYFPSWEQQAFALVERREGVLDEKNTLPHTFYTYERV